MCQFITTCNSDVIPEFYFVLFFSCVLAGQEKDNIYDNILYKKIVL